MNEMDSNSSTTAAFPPAGGAAMWAFVTCSLMLLMPSGPSRFTACFTRSVRPQFSILKPRSCRNLASVEAASSFLVAQKQSSALQAETRHV